jgi:hypothetical protein
MSAILTVSCTVEVISMLAKLLCTSGVQDTLILIDVVVRQWGFRLVAPRKLWLCRTHHPLTLLLIDTFDQVRQGGTSPG